MLEVDAPKPVTPPAEPASAQDASAADAPAADASANHPFGIDPANPFGTAQPSTPASAAEPFGGASTLPGGAN